MSDGTASGTKMVKDINPSGSSRPGNFFSHGGKLYFEARNGSDGKELWVSDGTTAGTKMLKDINPNGSSNPFGFVSYNGKLYFKARNGSDGKELWVTDGSTAGTQIVKDINQSGDSDPRDPITYNGKLYFSADDGSSMGRQLWAYQAKNDSLGVVAPAIAPKADPAKFFSSIQLNQTLYYRAGYTTTAGKELYKLKTTTNTGTANPLSVQDLQVYPNPVQEVAEVTFTLTEPSPVKMDLLDLTGQKLRTLKAGQTETPFASGNHQEQIDLSGLSPGMYLISVKTDQKSVTRKVVKE